MSDRRVACERDDGLLNVHAESETCEVCEGRVIMCPDCWDGEEADPDPACPFCHGWVEVYPDELTTEDT